MHHVVDICHCLAMNVEMNAYILEMCSSLPKAMGKEGERERSCNCKDACNNSYNKQQSEQAMIRR